MRTHDKEGNGHNPNSRANTPIHLAETGPRGRLVASDKHSANATHRPRLHRDRATNLTSLPRTDDYDHISCLLPCVDIPVSFDNLFQ